MSTYDTDDGFEPFDWVEGVEGRLDREADIFTYRVAGSIVFTTDDVEATYRADLAAGLPRPKHRDVLLRTAARVAASPPADPLL